VTCIQTEPDVLKKLKSEARNPKSETISKSKYSKFKTDMLRDYFFYFGH